MRILIALVLLTLPLSALTLAEQLQRAEVGDYLVTLQGRTYTLLLVQEKEGNTITFEEISVPRRHGGGPGSPWPTWVRRDAPGHSSWITFKIDTTTAKITHTYSRSQKKWLDANPFLPRLLTLDFQEIPDNQRKKTGSGHLWRPPGPNVPFNAYWATWPRDGSEIAGKRITIYLPAQAGNYPDYFPYWIEVTDLKIRVVDTGSGLLWG